MKVRALTAIGGEPMRQFGEVFDVDDEAAATAMIASGAVEAVEETETAEHEKAERAARPAAKKGR